jgi:hypothetical protein
MLVVAIAGSALGGGVWAYRMRRLSRYCAGVAHRKKTCENMCRYLAAVYSGYAEIDEESACRAASQPIDERLPKKFREHEEQRVKIEEQIAIATRAIAT